MTNSRAAHLAVADLLDILPDAVLMVDAQGHICYANPALRATLGYTADELLDQPVSLLVPQAARERHQELMARFRIDGPPKLMGSRPVLHAVHRSGRVVPVSISLTNFTLADGQRVTVAVIHDVTALHTDLDRATARAETDPLTGLGNRLRLSRRIEALLMSRRPFAVLYLDLEGFKRLNDQLGHAAGDQALRIVARRLRSQVREADLAARLGGDEFVVLLDGVDDAGRLERARSRWPSADAPVSRRRGEPRAGRQHRRCAQPVPRHHATGAAGSGRRCDECGAAGRAHVHPGRRIARPALAGLGPIPDGAHRARGGERGAVRQCQPAPLRGFRLMRRGALSSSNVAESTRATGRDRARRSGRLIASVLMPDNRQGHRRVICNPSVTSLTDSRL